MAVVRSPIHLNPATDLAERVLLPGDPHRALAVAQHVLESPRMFNHRRGLWGYTGTAPDGGRLTVQATGMGGPSAAIVLEELADLGARRIVRIGTCGALAGGLELGSLLVATEALSADGTSGALGAGPRVRAHADVTKALVAAAGPAATAGAVVSTDVFYDDRPGLEEGWATAGLLAVEMEAAALFRVAERRGLAAGCLLAVTDLLAGGPAERTRIDADGLEAAGLRLGEVGLAALAD